MLTFDLKVEGAIEKYHSGEFGGMIPDTFRVVRHLLSRIDDGESGKPSEEFSVEVPESKMEEAKNMADKLNDVNVATILGKGSWSANSVRRLKAVGNPI